MRWPWEKAGPAARIREEAAEPSGTLEDFYWGRPVSGTDEDYLWRRLSDNWYQKDLLPSTYLELHNQCYEAYGSNPLARQAIEITTSMVLGSGVKVVARSPRVQRLFDLFWNDPDNHMDLRLYSLCTELALYGEQFVRFFVNPVDGSVKIGQIDPSTIDEIVTDPNNIEKPIALPPATPGAVHRAVAVRRGQHGRARARGAVVRSRLRSGAVRHKQGEQRQARTERPGHDAGLAAAV